jgi:hypothetical protein
MTISTRQFCCAAIGSGATRFAESMRHTISFHGHPGAEVRFAFEGGELEYIFTRAPNRGDRGVTIDGMDKGRLISIRRR